MIRCRYRLESRSELVDIDTNELHHNKLNHDKQLQDLLLCHFLISNDRLI